MNTPNNDPNAVLQELENAKSIYSSGNHAAAEPALREVFEKLSNHPEGLAFCAECLSEIYTAWGKFSEAIKVNQRFINLSAPHPNRNVVSIGTALERIAAVSLKVGKQEQSEKLHKLAQAVKAGKVDVTTLVTDKAKLPGAPPTTEHTYTFQALSPDSPAPPGYTPGNPFTQSQPTQPLPSPAPQPPAPPMPAAPVQPAQTPPNPFQQPAAPPPAQPTLQPPGNPAIPPAKPSSDVLARPIKETAMFSKPGIANLPHATPPGAIPPGAAPPAVTPPGASQGANVPPGSIPDYQLADFDEEVAVDPSQLSGTHAVVNPASPEAPVVMPASSGWGAGDPADFADFDEAVPVNPNQLSGAHPAVNPAQSPPAPQVNPAQLAGLAAPPGPAAAPGPSSAPGFAAPASFAVPPGPSGAPPGPATPAVKPSSDVLARPIKETAMFSRPTVPDSANVQPPGDVTPPQASEGQGQELSGWGSESSGDEQGGWGPADPADFEGSIPANQNPAQAASTPSPPGISESAQGSGSQTPAPPAPAPPQSALPADAWGPRDSADLPQSNQGATAVPFVQFMNPSAQSAQTAPVDFPASGSESLRGELSNAQMAQAAFANSDQMPVDDAPPPETSQHSSPHGASSARSIRSMSSRTMEAPPVSSGNEMGGFMGLIAGLFLGKRDSDAPVQQIEDASVTSAKAAGVLVLLTAVVVGSFNCLYTVLPRKTNAEKAYLSSQHRYISGDSAKTFTMVDAGTCEFGIGDRKFRPRMKFYLDDWHDAVDLALGKATQKQFCMYRTDDGIMDDDGSKVYLYGGPEIQLANKVEIVTQYAGLCFARTKKYPDRGDVISVADLHYQNPYTKESEVPSFHHVVVGKGISVSLEADEARTKFYDRLLSGELPEETPEAHPGEMRCYAVDFLSPRGNTQGFVIQLIGKDGKPVYGARPHTRYLHALEEGKEYKPVGPPELPFKGEEGLKPVVVWMMNNKLDSNFMLFLTMTPVIMFTVFSFVFLVLAFIIPRGLGRAVAWLLFAGNALPAVLFCMSKMNL